MAAGSSIPTMLLLSWAVLGGCDTSTILESDTSALSASNLASAPPAAPRPASPASPGPGLPNSDPACNPGWARLMTLSSWMAACSPQGSSSTRLPPPPLPRKGKFGAVVWIVILTGVLLWWTCFVTFFIKGLYRACRQDRRGPAGPQVQHSSTAMQMVGSPEVPTGGIPGAASEQEFRRGIPENSLDVWSGAPSAQPLGESPKRWFEAGYVGAFFTTTEAGVIFTRRGWRTMLSSELFGRNSNQVVMGEMASRAGLSVDGGASDNGVQERREDSNRAAEPASALGPPSDPDGLLEDDTCVICFSAPKECIFAPCGHHVTCMACGTLIEQQKDKPCPICRTGIEALLMVIEV